MQELNFTKLESALKTKIELKELDQNALEGLILDELVDNFNNEFGVKNQELLDELVEAVIEKARAILPEVLKKDSAEALSELLRVIEETTKNQLNFILSQ